MFTLALLAFCGILGANGQIITDGQCDPTPQPISDFDVESYLGLWYEIARTPNVFEGGQCVTAEYSLSDVESGVVNVYNAAVVQNFLQTVNGSATLEGDDGRGALIVSFPSVGFVPTTSNYWVLDTDYVSYALVYNCQNINTEQRSISVWKLGRTTSYTENMNIYLNILINNIDGISSGDLQDTDHSAEACFLLPDLAPGEAVVIDGQCDLDIPVVQDFDAERYLGVWHDIASYPSEFQNGTCSNSRYSLTDGGTVDVVNTQVVDQLLDTVVGTATADTSGAGRLLVTFPDGQGGTVQLEYLILATDYENYSLVYSCLNLNGQQMRVWSWKLSRERQLSAESAAAIDAVTSNQLVLNDRYYVTADQSDTGCFYLPVSVAGVPVVFPGLCEDSVPAVANFDPSSYAGVWYDVEKYPSDSQPGTCNTVQYTLTADGALEVYSTQVVGERLYELNGVAQLLPGETSGKLSLSFPDNDTGISVARYYWVLATDYDSYSLVYMCENIGNSQRLVWSSKQSRTSQLSTAANAAMAEVIDTVSVLDDQYFEPADQTEEACFYFPEAQPGVPVVFPGQCDLNISVVEDFDAARYLGLWHEIAAYPMVFQGGDCSNALYTATATGTVEVYNTQVLAERLDTINGSAIADPSGRGVLYVSFPIAGTDQIAESEYWILDTDYDTYSIVYTCMNINSQQRAIGSWKLSRTKELTDAANTAMDAIIDSVLVLDNQYYQPTAQSDDACFYRPYLEPNEPVIFMGQCDENIPVVQDFDPVRYQGLWNEIESYYSEFQDGTCNNALYTINDEGVVDVYNTQVVNALLETISGTAVPISDGKLQVTFPIEGTNQSISTEYWVLDTDYDDYAIVYTCVNLDEFNRRVWSWKLSRTRQLSEAAIEAIDSIVSTIPVLNDDHYNVRNQTDDGCFYFPEPNGQPVTFRGQCDDSIPAVADFNISRYAGVWYDVEKYPSDSQPGTCNTVQYTLTADGALEVYSTQVVGERLYELSGVAQLLPGETSGKLSLSFPDNDTGINVSRYFWVLATDYESYSLVYKCENIGDDLRIVWSSKQSRSNQLSAAANAEIAEVIETINVLDEQYFEPADQTEEACFYFPEAQPGVPVVFPGQCDLNISVVENFDAARYLGLWHEIAAYPMVFQGGDCSNALYTATATGAVEVYNTQVLAERLDTINGSATADPSGRGVLYVSFPIAGTDQIAESEYWILDTDYDTYSIVYTCMNINSQQRAIGSWKLSRTKELSEAANTAMDAIIDSVLVLDNQYYQPTAQSDDACFYRPYLEPNEPVIFIGQCDENIPVVQDFDPVRYQGIWHEIESYYSEFQDGTCNNALYTINDEGVVDVYNTQVVNVLLETISGTAVPISNGKLEVTFPIEGTNQNISTEYWVLDTDYDDYAIVYTCVNIDEFYRRVWSWKLSRTRQLSEAAIEAIDSIVSAIPVLNDDHYNVRDQTDDGCFYLPEPNGQRVTFRGRCDDSIPAVADFNISSYAGVWYDVEKYPSDSQPGTCNTVQYTLTADGALEAYSTQVVGERLYELSGVAQLLPGETSGKLSLSFPDSDTGISVARIYWVLATDYDSYSLVYNCENIGDDQRIVWSSKQSRTSQLSTAANAAMAEVIETINVLDEQYFEPADQTEEGCFYFPEAQPGVPVVFPGQCDLNISIVENFDAARYLGLWHEIAAYPSMFQDGACNNALYTATATGAVEVYNTQVLADRLDTINGSAVADPSGRGILYVSFPIAGTDQTAETEYWILDTDYDSYSIVYTCMNINAAQRAVWSWKLSRTKELTAAASAAIDAVVASVQVLDEQYYQQSDQSDEACFYLPYLEDGEPAIFVGQCDLNIPAQPDFDPVRYMGVWYEIESYPSAFQSGTCNTAEYALTAEGTVAVYNTQVVGERLQEVRGEARLAADDGSGKLEVTFPVEGTDQTVTTNYWVLRTDYDGYALVYSCVNLDSTRRQGESPAPSLRAAEKGQFRTNSNNVVVRTGIPDAVWSWKLSREKQLTEEANAEIAEVVATVPVLSEEYYATGDQSADGCFYFPTAVPGQSVIFPGQCDETVAVVQNFDAERYTGFWYEVASYPQPFQAGGTCANALYTLNADGTVAVYNTQVVAQQLDTIDGVARLDSDIGEAKLLVSFPIPGTDFSAESPYWVVATDYDNYAVVYSCTNLGPNSRYVSSWKLSREPTLNAAAVIAVDAAVDSVQVLSEEYYEETGQTEADCFFYPDNNGGPVLLDGQCELPEDVPAIEDFDVTQFLGTWYETARFPSELQEGECARTQLSGGAGGVGVVSTLVSRELQLEAAAQAAVVGGRGVLAFSFEDSDGAADNNYYILDTDYDNFALAYSCRNVGTTQKQVYSWKLSRDRDGLTSEASARIDAVVSAREDLFEGYYEATDQGDAACFHYPDFADVSSAIVLPGPCNQSIQGVPNFQADLYTGRWFEIARYPQVFEIGECARAEYALTESGVVDVVNTIVYEQSLETVRGTAVADAGGNGELIVSFPVFGTDQFSEANYYVLDTDYVNYALVYSCRDLDSGDRQVSSWKLSRQPTLAAEFEALLEPTIEATQGLLESYYLTTDQSDEACFYYPELDESQPILFRGQCEEVEPLADFDIERYLGWWHELEHYPSGFDSGACVSSRLEAAAGGYVSVDTGVSGLVANVSRSELVVAADAPGRLRKTLSNGQVIDIWVLATDYETYSLLYSCENVGSEYRRVWSAKHSKTRELTAAAQAAMAPTIEAARLLRSEYYLPVDQSDEACFHYPALGPGDQVVLSGQCDEGIPVVAEFDVPSYTGVWYQTEHYPQPWESGSCPAVRYTLDVSGELRVVRARIVDGELREREGTATASDAGDGRLTVTFAEEEDLETSTVELYVLATDYVTYSIVYSCENINEFQRLVGSWKLSRTRSMPASGAAAISAVVSARPELHQPYFVDSQQNDDCPEPSAAGGLRAVAAMVTLLAVILHLFM